MQRFFRLSRGAILALAALIAWISGGSAVYMWATGFLGVAIAFAGLTAIVAVAVIEGRIVSNLQGRRLLKSRGYAMMLGWILVGILVASLSLVMPESSLMRRAITGALGFGALWLTAVVVWQMLKAMGAPIQVCATRVVPT
ncbi:MAG TPA: hypothetical protein VJ123_03255 [Anaerolineales bacterium]|nr:hypothetical protein [Anaerolineales bacterium]